LPHPAALQFAGAIRDASAHGEPLVICGGGTKDFYGLPTEGTRLDVCGHAGIIDYEPTELVIIVRGGTLLTELEAALAQRGQRLSFEPPHFAAGSTVAGMLSAGLAGPRRIAAGGLRDFVLGVRIIDGRGRILSFGGRVMKNVAGYDVSRAFVGALGTLGVILDVSLKVLPGAASVASLRFAMDEAEALERLLGWSLVPLPITGTAWHDGTLRVRLEGADAAVRAAAKTLGGEREEEAVSSDYWRSLRDHALPFFAAATTLWRVAVPPGTPRLAVAAPAFIEWGGTQRWYAADLAAQVIRAQASDAGGHAVLFRATAQQRRDTGVFAMLGRAEHAIQRRLKEAFDPQRILNRGRMYVDL